MKEGLAVITREPMRYLGDLEHQVDRFRGFLSLDVLDYSYMVKWLSSRSTTVASF
jgi:hypothetical protein